MNEQKIQNAAPIIPVYDEDNLPDERFYPEGLDDPNGPNADALRATASGEVIEPENATLPIPEEDEPFFEDCTSDPDYPDKELIVKADLVGEILDPEEEYASQLKPWDILPEEEDSSERTTGWTPREGAKLEIEYLD